MRLEDGMPDIRRVAEGRNASGRGWIGLTTREAYLTTDVTITPLVSAWLFLLMAAGLMLGAWLSEGTELNLGGTSVSACDRVDSPSRRSAQTNRSPPQVGQRTVLRPRQPSHRSNACARGESRPWEPFRTPPQIRKARRPCRGSGCSGFFIGLGLSPAGSIGLVHGETRPVESG
jgi:hypothetical protein